jgi:hypothetical protein
VNRSARILLGALALTVVWFVWQWYTLARQREKQAPRGGDVLLGFVTNFLRHAWNRLLRSDDCSFQAIPPRAG